MSLFNNVFRQKRTRIELDLTDEQIDQLRRVVDGLPLDPYASLVVAVLKQLPLESDAVPSNNGGGADREGPHPQGSPGGFSLIPFTPKGRERLPEIEKLLATLPHGSDSL